MVADWFKTCTVCTRRLVKKKWAWFCGKCDQATTELIVPPE